MDLSLVTTVALVDELEKRSHHGIIYMVNAGDDPKEDAHKYKFRDWGSPLILSGVVRVLQRETDKDLDGWNAIDPEEF